MQIQLNGSTRVHYVVGEPIAHVKSPAGVTAAFAERGHNAIVIPAQVTPGNLTSWLDGVSRNQNVDGIIVATPHKFAFFELCQGASDRANFLSSINVMRRNADGHWQGDILDGEGLLRALYLKDFDPRGRSVLIVGAGGTGAAAGYALTKAGVAKLAIHDADTALRDSLVQRLSSLRAATVSSGGRNPEGFDIVINATPAVMQTHTTLPIDIQRFRPGMLVACFVSPPPVTPLIEAAREHGCETLTGMEIFTSVRDLMVDFLLTNVPPGRAESSALNLS